MQQKLQNSRGNQLKKHRFEFGGNHCPFFRSCLFIPSLMELQYMVNWIGHKLPCRRTKCTVWWDLFNVQSCNCIGCILSWILFYLRIFTDQKPKDQSVRRTYLLSQFGPIILLFVFAAELYFSARVILAWLLQKLEFYWRMCFNEISVFQVSSCDCITGQVCPLSNCIVSPALMIGR